jgi:hypothetical protein
LLVAKLPVRYPLPTLAVVNKQTKTPLAATCGSHACRAPKRDPTHESYVKLVDYEI